MGLLDRFRKKPDRPVESRKTPTIGGRYPGRRISGVRLHDSASHGRMTSGWHSSDVTPDQMIRRDLKMLRNRSREQFANNDYMARFVGMLISNTIGPKGARLQVQSRDDNGDFDAADNTAIETYWNAWGRTGVCELTARLSWVEVQKLMITSFGVDGELLCVENYTREGYKLLMIDAALLDVDYTDPKPRDGGYIRFGIHYNDQDQPIWYYVLNDKGEYYASYNSAGNGRRYTRYPADRVIHAFIPVMVGQRRGLPLARTALLRMNMLNGYEDAAITAARVGAAKMGFFTSEDGEGYSGDDVIEGEGNEADIIVTDADPGSFEQLPDGVGFEKFDPDYPHAMFKDFVKAILRGIASGLGINYNSLANDLEGVNYSSIRAGVLEDREVWKALQEWLFEKVHHRVYPHWLEWELTRGAITSEAGLPLPYRRLPKWLPHRWQGKRWPWVDPLKDTQANVLGIQNGLKSRRQIIMEAGADPEETWAELLQENEQLGDILTTASPAIEEQPQGDDDA